MDIDQLIQEHPNLSNVELGRRAGVNESTIRRHRAKLAVADVDPMFGIPRAAITRRGASYYNPETGWEIIRYDPQRAALLETAASYDDIEKAIADYAIRPLPKNTKPVTAVFCPADLQIGKVDRNGGTQGTVQRVLRATEDFVTYCLLTRPSEILIAELGDSLEGFSNTPTQRAQNDLDLTTQVRTVRRLLVEVVKRLSPYAPHVTLAAVPSNHAQVRIEGTKSLASTPGNDWGIEVNHQIEDVLSERAGFEHVRFVRPETEWDEAMTFTTESGLLVGMVHGHQAGKQERVADWWKGQAFGRRNGLDGADVLLHGHWHNLGVSQSGDDRWLIGAASADPGSSWFTNYSGDSATAGVTALDLSSASTVPWSNLRIL